MKPGFKTPAKQQEAKALSMVEATFLPLFPSTQNNRLGYKTEEQARNDSAEVSFQLL